MASMSSTPRSRSRSRSSTASSDSSDTTMLDAPPLAPARPRPFSQTSLPSTTTTAAMPVSIPSPSPSKDTPFSLLLSLPRELRDRIYVFALTSPFPFWWPSPSCPKHDIALGLLTASRQLYDEAASILYQSNKFLFTHPSDCNVFRVVSSSYSALITSVCFRIREKDLRLWTAYLGSRSKTRSLKMDLPKLKSLWIFLRCGNMTAPGLMGHVGGGNGQLQHALHAIQALPPAIAAQVHAVQNALGQQVQALQQQLMQLQQAAAYSPHQSQHPPLQQTSANQQHPVQNHAGGNMGHGSATPSPPPSAPNAMPFAQFAQGGFQGQNNPPNPLTSGGPNQHHMQQQDMAPQLPLPQHPHPQYQHVHQHAHPGNHQSTFYNTFLRIDRELGLETLCLSLADTKPAACDVKIVCIMRLPKTEVQRLVRVWPEELVVDRNGDARTRFRKLHGCEVSFEVSGYD